jgi:non-homologous end joining protein Ku
MFPRCPPGHVAECNRFRDKPGVNELASWFEPEKFEDQYETALIDLINKKRAGKPITPKERPRG